MSRIQNPLFTSWVFLFSSPLFRDVNVLPVLFSMAPLGGTLVYLDNPL